ncbi:MAG: hypothetical protein SFZ03_10145 [Candidatus Melainabacteria bacterium]|nr:hypothetical protein [Candidatus Melainabacteria bacterium]
MQTLSSTRFTAYHGNQFGFVTGTDGSVDRCKKLAQAFASQHPDTIQVAVEEIAVNEQSFDAWRPIGVYKTAEFASVLAREAVQAGLGVPSTSQRGDILDLRRALEESVQKNRYSDEQNVVSEAVDQLIASSPFRNVKNREDKNLISDFATTVVMWAYSAGKRLSRSGRPTDV